MGLQFQQTDRGWRERLVDVAQEGDADHLRLVLAPQDTPASKLLLSRRLQGLPPGAGDTHSSKPNCRNALEFWLCACHGNAGPQEVHDDMGTL